MPRPEYEAIQHHLERPTLRRLLGNADVAEIIDTCRPEWPVPWLYPLDYPSVAIGKTLRRFRDPVLAIRATLWALRMSLAWRWQRNEISPVELEAWNDFIQRVENEEPFPPGYREQLEVLTDELQDWTFDLIFHLIRAVRNLNRPDDSGYRILDEEDYYALGSAILRLLERTRYKPLSLPSAGRGVWDRVVPRWWEILQCVLPIRDILGPPITFAEIEESGDEFSWGQEVLQALVGPLTEILAPHFSEINHRVPDDDFTRETWAGYAYWAGYTYRNTPVLIHMDLPVWVEPPTHVEIKVEVVRDEEAGHFMDDPDFFFEEWFDFPIDMTIEKAVDQIESAVGEAMRQEARRGRRRRR